MSEELTYQQVLNLFAETDRKFAETDRKFAETDRKFAETDRKFAETDRKIAQTEKLVDKVSRNLGDIGNRLGEFVEEMIRPAAVRLFQERGIAVHEVHRDVTTKRNREAIEIDLLVVNDTDIVAIECKSQYSLDKVDKHIERMSKVQRMFPKYADMNIYGAIAGMVITDSVARYAEEEGLFVLMQNGEQISLFNAEPFKPKSW